MRPCFFVPAKWRLPERIPTTLPVAVILKRLAAPRWVFSFFFGLVEFLGIAGISPQYFTRNRTVTPVARLAADLVLLLGRPFSVPAALRERCLPCAASSRSAHARLFRPAY